MQGGDCLPGSGRKVERTPAPESAGFRTRPIAIPPNAAAVDLARHKEDAHDTIHQCLFGAVFALAWSTAEARAEEIGQQELKDVAVVGQATLSAPPAPAPTPTRSSASSPRIRACASGTASSSAPTRSACLDPASLAPRFTRSTSRRSRAARESAACIGFTLAGPTFPPSAAYARMGAGGATSVHVEERCCA